MTNDKLVISEVSHIFKQMSNKGPKEVKLINTDNVVVLKIQGILNKGQLVLAQNEKYFQILEQYQVAFIKENILPEIVNIFLRHMKTEIISSFEKLELKENLLIVVLIMTNE